MKTKDLEKRLSEWEEKLKRIVSLVDGLTPLSTSWDHMRDGMLPNAFREYVEDGVMFKDYFGFDLTYKPFLLASGGNIIFERDGKVVLHFRYIKETKPLPSGMQETFTIIDDVEKYEKGPWERIMDKLLAMPNHERMSGFIEPKVEAYQKPQEKAQKREYLRRERESKEAELSSRAARLGL
ncbi:MAG: hypothetical protein V1839_01720 [archaeon]